MPWLDPDIPLLQVRDDASGDDHEVPSPTTEMGDARFFSNNWPSAAPYYIRIALDGSIDSSSVHGMLIRLNPTVPAT